MSGYLVKRPRMWRPRKVMTRYQLLEQREQQAKNDAVQKAQKLSSDPAEFFEQVVGFKPFPHQEEFIRLFVDAFIRNKHPRFKKELAASRHQPFGKTSDTSRALKMPALRSWRG